MLYDANLAHLKMSDHAVPPASESILAFQHLLSTYRTKTTQMSPGKTSTTTQLSPAKGTVRNSKLVVV